MKIERVQKAALASILGTYDFSYDKVLKLNKLDTLATRREKMCVKFIKKNMDSANPLLTKFIKHHNTRDKSKVVKEFQCRTKKYFNSALPYLARLLNSTS